MQLPKKPEYSLCNAGHQLVPVFDENRGGWTWDCPTCINKMREAQENDQLIPGWSLEDYDNYVDYLLDFINDNTTEKPLLPGVWIEHRQEEADYYTATQRF